MSVVDVCTQSHTPAVRALFHILGVDYEDRDVSMSAAWRDEMEHRVGAKLQVRVRLGLGSGLT